MSEQASAEPTDGPLILEGDAVRYGDYTGEVIAVLFDDRRTLVIESGDAGRTFMVGDESTVELLDRAETRWDHVDHPHYGE